MRPPFAPKMPFPDASAGVESLISNLSARLPPPEGRGSVLDPPRIPDPTPAASTCGWAVGDAVGGARNPEVPLTLLRTPTLRLRLSRLPTWRPSSPPAQRRALRAPSRAQPGGEGADPQPSTAGCAPSGAAALAQRQGALDRTVCSAQSQIRPESGPRCVTEANPSATTSPATPVPRRPGPTAVRTLSLEPRQLVAPHSRWFTSKLRIPAHRGQGANGLAKR